jgi:hypothetical protein
VDVEASLVSGLGPDGWWTKGDLPLAEKYARKALALEPDLAEAHASLGILARIYWIEGRVPDALAEEKEAATMAHLPARLRRRGLEP